MSLDLRKISQQVKDETNRNVTSMSLDLSDSHPVSLRPVTVLIHLLPCRYDSHPVSPRPECSAFPIHVVWTAVHFVCTEHFKGKSSLERHVMWQCLTNRRPADRTFLLNRGNIVVFLL